MGEKKGFLVKKDSRLPYIAAALGGVMLLFCFAYLGTYMGKSPVFQAKLPLFGFMTGVKIQSVITELFLLFSSVTMLLAGGTFAKKNPIFIALPPVFYALSIVGFMLASSFLMEAAFSKLLIQFLIAILVAVVSILAVCGILKTKWVVAFTAFAAAIFNLVAFFTRDSRYGLAFGCFSTIHFTDMLGALDIGQLIQCLCLYAGVGVLALSLEYADLPAQVGTYAPAAGGIPAGARPQAETSFQTEGLSPCLKERRGIAACILLSFVTCGIYLIYWQYTLCKKLRAWAGESEDCAGETACLVLAPFYNIYWMYTRGKKLFASSCARGIPAQDNAVVYLLLDIFGLGIVSYALIQNEFNKIADLCSRPAPAPSSAPAPKPEPDPQPAQEPQPVTAEDRIVQLRERLEKGEISQEEYDAKFQELLRLQ